MQKKWIVGLGNPGKKYAWTRHNAGFLAVTQMAEQLKLSLDREKHQSFYARTELDGSELTLVLPQTFMNASGDSLAEWKRREGMDIAKDLLVIVDDMDLPFGKLRIRAEGSAGSHNGLASLIERLGSGSFARLRIGIGKPANPEDWPDYVTGSFNPEEKKALEPVLQRAADGARLWLNEPSFEKLMAKVNA
jgi:PTH1 family peptidyl-tRNA hydrolase